MPRTLPLGKLFRIRECVCPLLKHVKREEYMSTSTSYIKKKKTQIDKPRLQSIKCIQPTTWPQDRDFLQTESVEMNEMQSLGR